MQIINGKEIAERIDEETRQIISAGQFEHPPLLEIYLATDDEPSHRYAELKKKKAEQLGIRCQISSMTDSNTADELVEDIHMLLELKARFPHGAIVQLPLYEYLEPDRFKILNAIPQNKDADGLTAMNLGALTQDIDSATLPATVAAILEALKHVSAGSLEGWIQGKHVVIVNHSSLIGKPLAAVLLAMNATVSVAHKFTKDLEALTTKADVLITAAGTPGLITSEHIKQDAVVIDVTSMKTDAGIVGDVAVDEVFQQKAAWLSPVPGGIGPLTVSCLLRNLVKLPITNSQPE